MLFSPVKQRVGPKLSHIGRKCGSQTVLCDHALLMPVEQGFMGTSNDMICRVDGSCVIEYGVLWSMTVHDLIIFQFRRQKLYILGTLLRKTLP